MTESPAPRLPVGALYERTRRVLVDSWRRHLLRGPDLLPVQTRAVNELNVLGDEGSEGLVTICAPMGSGRTTLLEMCASHAADAGGRALLVVPPAHNHAVRRFGCLRARYEMLKFGVVFSSRRVKKYDRRIGRRDFGLAVVTLDKLPDLLRSETELVGDLNLVVADDLERLGDGHDPAIELLLNRVRGARRPPPFLGTFAAETPARAFSSWYGTDLLVDTSLPPEGRRGRYSVAPFRDGGAQGIGTDDVDGRLLVNCAETATLSGDQQVVMMAGDAEHAMTLARILARKTKFPPSTRTIGALEGDVPSDTSAALRRVLASGIGFLHDSMDPSKAGAVERGFSSGDIRVLVTSIHRDWRRPSPSVAPRVVVYDRGLERPPGAPVGNHGEQRSAVRGTDIDRESLGTAPAPSAPEPAAAIKTRESTQEGAAVDIWIDVRTRSGRLLGMPFSSPRHLSHKRFAQFVAVTRECGKVVSTRKVAEVEEKLCRPKKRPMPENAADLKYQLLKKFRRFLPKSMHTRAEELFTALPGDGIRFNGTAEVIGGDETVPWVD